MLHLDHHQVALLGLAVLRFDWEAEAERAREGVLEGARSISDLSRLLFAVGLEGLTSKEIGEPDSDDCDVRADRKSQGLRLDHEERSGHELRLAGEREPLLIPAFREEEGVQR